MIEVVEVDPRDDALFTRWHSALRDGQLAGRPPVPFFGLPEYRELHTSPENLARYGRVALAAIERGVVVGAAEVSLPHRWDTATAAVEVGVTPQQRRRGVGSALWERTVHHADAHGRTTIETEVAVPVGDTVAASGGGAFALGRGFVTGNIEEHFLLALPLRPLPTVAEPSAYHFLTWSGTCPEEHADDFARLQTAMAADAPHGDMDREERTVTVQDVRTSEGSLAARAYDSITTMAVHSDEDPAGYSVMYVSGHEPEHVHQDDTLVARRHRGHGLGRALKLRNHRVLDERHPARRWIHTWTEVDNAPMQRVNRSLGYRAVEVMHEMTYPR